jgi:DNA-binding transcriptional regulator YiaG
MIDPRTWLDKHIELLRLEHNPNGDPEVDVVNCLWNLAQEIGVQLRGCSHTHFAMIVQAMVEEYTAPQAPAAAEPSASSALVVNGVTSTLTLPQLKGAEVRFGRQGKKMKQNDLAEIVDIPNSTISRWENGEFIPTDAQVKTMGDALGLPLTPMPTKQLPL